MAAVRSEDATAFFTQELYTLGTGITGGEQAEDLSGYRDAAELCGRFPVADRNKPSDRVSAAVGKNAAFSGCGRLIRRCMLAARHVFPGKYHMENRISADYGVRGIWLQFWCFAKMHLVCGFVYGVGRRCIRFKQGRILGDHPVLHAALSALLCRLSGSSRYT